MIGKAFREAYNLFRGARSSVRTSIGKDTVPTPRDIAQAQQWAESHAEGLRKKYWGKDYPVDPVKIATEFGIDVVVTRLPESVSGVFIKRPGHDPIIALEEEDSVRRRRFTAAHELAHYILTFSEDEVEKVDRRDRVSSEGIEPVEVYANTFAANLLMPRAEVEKLYRRQVPLISMANHFGVSDDAIRFRLKNLGYSEALEGVPVCA